VSADLRREQHCDYRSGKRSSNRGVLALRRRAPIASAPLNDRPTSGRVVRI